MVITQKNDGLFPAPPKTPKSVLFVCSRNACRSPMAFALAQQHSRGRIFIDSVGLHPGDLDGFSIAVMSEIGLDITNHTPKDISEVDPRNFELIVSLTPESHHQLMEHLEGDAVAVEYWPTFDPSTAKGNRDQILDTYRHVRDQLKAQIERRINFNAAE